MSKAVLAQIESEAAVAPYVYRPVSGSGNGDNGSQPRDGGSPHESLWTPSAGRDGGGGESTEENAQAREKCAREDGVQEGEARVRTEYEKALDRERETLAAAVREFALDRDGYCRRVEGEVVRLALAIARKILRREAQLDPLLLTGVVRVALEQVTGGTSLRLRVHPEQVGVWREYFTHQPDLQLAPDVMGDASLEPGRCVLETALGSTDLSLETQLKEIERGFFDLLSQETRKS